MMTVEECKSHVEYLKDCCLYVDFDVDRISEVLFSWSSGNEEYADRDGFVVFKTTDGRFVVVSDNEDSGCGSELSEFATLEELRDLGLTDDQRSSAGDFFDEKNQNSAAKSAQVKEEKSDENSD